MPRVWQWQEAKSRFSELVEQAIISGPQIITQRGTEVAVVMSSKQYHELTARPERLSEFFRTSPLAGVDIDLRRDKGMARSEPK